MSSAGNCRLSGTNLAVALAGVVTAAGCPLQKLTIATVLLYRHVSQHAIMHKAPSCSFTKRHRSRCLAKTIVYYAA